MSYAFKDLCIRGGRLIIVPGLDPATLLWAIGGAESSFGANNTPQHEPAFHIGGRYYEWDISREFGCLAHCSLGPWQVMYTNVRRITHGSVKPVEMLTDEIALLVTCDWLQRGVIDRFQARTVHEIADTWNSGNPRDVNVPHAYIAKVERYYQQALSEGTFERQRIT